MKTTRQTAWPTYMDYIQAGLKKNDPAKNTSTFLPRAIHWRREGKRIIVWHSGQKTEKSGF